MVFRKNYFFTLLKQTSKMFKNSYFTRSRSRTHANSEDGAICNISLQLKAIYYSVVTRNSFLNVGRVGRGPRSPFDCKFLSQIFLANLKILQWKAQKLEQPCNQNHSQTRKKMFLPQMILKTTIQNFKSYMQFNVIYVSSVCHSYVIRMYSFAIHMPFLCHSNVLVCHSHVTRICSYAIRMSLVCGFTMNLIQYPQGIFRNIWHA